jgi:predicted HTH domain antitoxin
MWGFFCIFVAKYQIMHLDIPDDIAEASQLDEAELRLELAIALYAAQKLSFGQARRLSGLDWFSFRSMLHERHISIHYDVGDLETDVENLKHLHAQ